MGSGEDGVGMTAVSRSEISKARVGCAGHSLYYFYYSTSHHHHHYKAFRINPIPPMVNDRD